MSSWSDSSVSLLSRLLACRCWLEIAFKIRNALHQYQKRKDIKNKTETTHKHKKITLLFIGFVLDLCVERGSFVHYKHKEKTMEIK